MCLEAISRNPTRESLRLLAMLSLEAYAPERTAKDNAWLNCTTIRAIIDDASGMKAVIVADAATVVVAIAGTEPRDWKDWKRDKDVVLVPHKSGGNVHRGFKTGWDALLPPVRDALDEMGLFNSTAVIESPWGQKTVCIRSGKKLSLPAGWNVVHSYRHARQLVFTGHSLGGVVATLGAMELDADLCVTFGSPCLGDAWFAKLFDINRQHQHLRVTHGNDIVPRLLQHIDDYRHCGTHVLLDRKDRIRVEPDRLEVWKDRLLGYRFDLLRDHKLGSYLEALS